MGKKRKKRAAQVSMEKNHGYTIVVPVFDDQPIDRLVRLALQLAAPRNGRVVLVGTVLVPPDESLTTGAVEAQARRTLLDGIRERFQGEPIYIKPRIRVAHRPWLPLMEVIAAEHASLLLLPWRPEGTKAAFALDLDTLLSHLTCDTLVLSGDLPEKISRILLPARGSQETALALETALLLAKANQAKITILYAADEDRHPRSRQIYDELVRMAQGNPLIAQELRVNGNVLAAIQAQAGQHDLIIMGAAEAAPGQRAQTVGRIPHHLHQEQSGTPLVIVRTARPAPVAELRRWNENQSLPATPTSVMVDRWFAENTFSSNEFKEVERLVAMKEERGVTISLGLPALNEEETVGNVIRTIKSALMDDLPLLDEIVLIDSGSTDYTVDIARDLGIPVYRHSDILPQYGTFRGKGEALWKSLYILKGDLIAWIDTDIVNIHPRFVYGILGPLLRHDTIQYVKGFYRRPLKVGETYQAGGGGRVTELVARPMFNLFYPELSGLVQPLSGEYAGRRRALERTPFYVGYGVETGLLLNLVEQYGISGIAQVDLLTRIHRNQSLSALSRMAFAIIQVFIDHLEQRQKVKLLSEINRTMKIIRYEMETYSLEERPIHDHCRPPIITLPEYRRRYNISEADWNEADFARWQEPQLEEELLV
ncbi:MAG: glucosyl-3-phosphoglycerate synthase [Chloroflexi bacterium]|nr:MAG: glucosyl-3-phosphoglycerate synthase [Chloroflexota bacterium]